MRFNCDALFGLSCPLADGKGNTRKTCTGNQDAFLTLSFYYFLLYTRYTGRYTILIVENKSQHTNFLILFKKKKKKKPKHDLGSNRK